MVYASHRANYSIVKNVPNEPLVIRDIGPWETHLSVTNAAEQVTRELFQGGKLANGRRLFYYDSEGLLDELVHKEGRFVRFAPVDPDPFDFDVV